MPVTRTQSQGKTSFVKEFLHDHPHGNTAAVNEAWESAGMSGSISSTLVNKTRSALGLAGNLRGKRSARKGTAGEKPAYTGKKRGRKPKNATIQTTAGEARSKTSHRTATLVELESDIDLLLFKVMKLGDLAEIERALRETRRLLYGGFGAKN
jgi:hypothetical protein